MADAATAGDRGAESAQAAPAQTAAGPRAPFEELRWRLSGRGLAATLGIEFVEVSSERVVATMPVEPRTHQPFGLLHGGASVAEDAA